MFVSTINILRYISQFIVSSRFFLKLGVTGSTKTGMSPMVYRLSVSRSGVGCIGTVVALFFDMKRDLHLLDLYTVSRRESVCVSDSIDFWDDLSLTDDAPVTHSLYYVALLLPYEKLLLLTNFDYWFKEINFERTFRVRTVSSLLVN